MKYTIVSLLIFLIPQTCPADDKVESQIKKNWNQLSIGIGGYITNTNSSFRFGTEGLGIGLDIDFEEALGLKVTSLIFAGQIIYRFSENRRHAFQASYFQLSRTGTKEIEANLQLADKEYAAQSKFSSSYTIQLAKVEYLFSFLLDERVNLHASFGFYIMPINVDLKINDQSEEKVKYVAPLPTFGIGMFFYISQKLILKSSLHSFYLTIENYEGRMSDINLLLEYRAWRNLSFGFGYNLFNISLTEETNGILILGDFVGKTMYEHSGLVFYTSVNF